MNSVRSIVLFALLLTADFSAAAEQPVNPAVSRPGRPNILSLWSIHLMLTGWPEKGWPSATPMSRARSVRRVVPR